MDMIKIAALTLLATPAAAHDWYDMECCNTQDCAQVRADVIRIEGVGYHVHLEPGDHPLVSRTIDLVIPYSSNKIRKSQDEFYHACVGRSQNVFCIYVPQVFG